MEFSGLVRVNRVAAAVACSDNVDSIAGCSDREERPIYR